MTTVHVYVITQYSMLEGGVLRPDIVKRFRYRWMARVYQWMWTGLRCGALCLAEIVE